LNGVTTLTGNPTKNQAGSNLRSEHFSKNSAKEEQREKSNVPVIIYLALYACFFIGC
jgi:hypothetical protein